MWSWLSNVGHAIADAARWTGRKLYALGYKVFVTFPVWLWGKILSCVRWIRELFRKKAQEPSEQVPSTGEALTSRLS